MQDEAIELLRVMAAETEKAVDRWLENTLPSADIDIENDYFDVDMTTNEDGTITLRLFKVVDVAEGTVVPAFKVR